MNLWCLKSSTQWLQVSDKVLSSSSGSRTGQTETVCYIWQQAEHMLGHFLLQLYSWKLLKHILTERSLLGLDSVTIRLIKQAKLWWKQLITQRREEICLMLFTTEITLLVLPSRLRISAKGRIKATIINFLSLRWGVFTLLYLVLVVENKFFPNTEVIQDSGPATKHRAACGHVTSSVRARAFFSSLFFYDAGFPVSLGFWTGGRDCKISKWIYNDFHETTMSNYKLQHHQQQALLQQPELLMLLHLGLFHCTVQWSPANLKRNIKKCVLAMFIRLLDLIST